VQLDSASLHEFSASPVDGFWSTFAQFVAPSENETVLAEHTSRDMWGTVDVDMSDEDFGQVTVSIDAQNQLRLFSKTLTFPKTK
jgi:hypothetical protein